MHSFSRMQPEFQSSFDRAAMYDSVVAGNIVMNKRHTYVLCGSPSIFQFSVRSYNIDGRFSSSFIDDYVETRCSFSDPLRSLFCDQSSFLVRQKNEFDEARTLEV